jgi:uncharacterized protein (TIGR02145 family)
MKQIALTTVLLLTSSLIFSAVALAGTVTDIDGNVYQTVTIGSQVWMAENLKVTHYSNGDSIPCVTVDDSSWGGLTTGAACSYDNDPGNVDTYGRIYNWYAAADSRNLAPEGWHVPTDNDWKQLEIYLGMTPEQADAMGPRGSSPIGAKLKEAGSSHWNCPNTGSTNETGFTGLPGGCVDNSPLFYGKGTDAVFWAASEFTGDPTAGWVRDLTCNLDFFGRNGNAKDYGASVRCVQDAPADAGEYDGENLPNGFSLGQNYPNPFNPTTSIEYSLPARSHVRIEILSLLGQKVVVLVDEMKGAGKYRTEWNGTDAAGKAVSTGVYLYRFQTGDFVQTKKMLLIK